VLLVSLSLLLSLSLAVPIPVDLDEGTPILKQEHIELVNSLKTSWTAGRNPRFEGMSVADFKKLLGSKHDLPRYTLPMKDIRPSEDLPENFDSRTQWPACPTIARITDQGHCGSCWAWGATEALSDRFCIQGKVNVTLSAQDLTSCAQSNGCDGGYPNRAWDYMMKTGVVTEACYPTLMGQCQHPGCSELPTPKCNQTCVNGEVFTGSKHFAASAYSVSNNIEHIATEIMTHGPVEVSFEVYEDFATYTSGVYVHKTGKSLGGHAVKAIGWGVDKASGLKYWLVANSWNQSWGMNGFFMIERGVNECGIEADVNAGLAKV